MNRKHQNPYESPESAESRTGKRRFPLLTFIGIAVILVATGAAAVFMTDSAATNRPELMLRRGPAPERPELLSSTPTMVEALENAKTSE